MAGGQYFHSFSSGAGTGEKSYHQGEPTSGEIHGLFSVGLNGKTFLIDTKVGIKRQSIPMLRSQADTSNLRGENSINPEELWRRSQESWHHGAGQTYLDRPESDPGRFRRSRGVNVWEEWQLSLLKNTDNKRSSNNTNLQLLPVGNHLYLAEGPEVFFTQNVDTDTPSWTDTNVQAGEVDTSVLALATDGFNVYAALGQNGIHTTTRGASSWSHFGNNPSGRTYELVAFVKGRLIAAADHFFYNITASGAAPTPLNPDFGNTDFRWKAFAEGPGHIYAAGFSGDKSLIYRTAVRADGVALDAPVVAGELPDGELVRALKGYLGFMVIGTDLGVRFATIDGTGNLVIGQLIDEPEHAVLCFEPQDRFVWFGWTNFDGNHTGLGRLDLSVFTDPLTPAFASDLMAGTDAAGVQGEVTSVVTFQDLRVFAVSSVGVYAEEDATPEDGWLESGSITYGMPDDKIAVFFDLNHEPLDEGTSDDASVEVSLAVDGGQFDSIGTSSTPNATAKALDAKQKTGSRFEVRLELSASDSLEDYSPEVTRYTLRSYPGPKRGEILVLPILLHERFEVGDVIRHGDPKADFEAIKSMKEARRLVNVQTADENFSGFVEDYEFESHHLTVDGSFWNGTCHTKIKRVV